MKFLFQALIDFLYPNLCLGCHNVLNTKEEFVCLLCRTKIQETDFFSVRHNLLEQKFLGKINLHKAACLYEFSKDGIVQNMIQSLKYKNAETFGIHCGKLIGQRCLAHSFLDGDSVLIPVPLHKQKQKRRGYNQSELIAQGISEELKIEVRPDIIVRLKFTDSQTNKSRVERWNNVKDAFQVNQEQRMDSPMHFIIVDDVITTGATIEAMSNRLTEVYPQSKISILGIASADHM